MIKEVTVSTLVYVSVTKRELVVVEPITMDVKISEPDVMIMVVVVEKVADIEEVLKMKVLATVMVDMGVIVTVEMPLVVAVLIIDVRDV